MGIYDNPAQTDRFGNPLYGAAGNGGFQPGANALSGASWGPTDQGLSGLSPGRSGLGTVGGLAAPGGFGAVMGLGNAFNAGAQAAQLGDMAGQMQGLAPATTGQQVGMFGAGVLGQGMTNDSFGQAMIGLGFSPDQAAQAVANYNATGNVNTPSQAQAAIGPSFQSQGGGLASMAGDVGVNAASAAAFGASIAGTPSMAQGADGVNAAAGDMSAGFGGMASGGQATAASNSEGSQGGSGSNSNGGADGEAGGANGGGGGGGGDAYAAGGVVQPNHDFSTGSGMVHAEGLIKGATGGTEDALHTHVPVGSFIVPASVVSGLGNGNTIAGGKALAQAMPSADDRVRGQMVPVRLSAGEFVVHPAHVAAFGGGDMSAGAAKLNAMVAALQQDAAT